MLLLTVGHPSSGKSTWAAKWTGKLGVYVLERDPFRYAITGSVRPSGAETAVAAAMIGAMEAGLRDDKLVIFVDNFLSAAKRRDLYDIAEAAKVPIVLVDFLDVTAPECLKRDAERDNPAGANVIQKSFVSFPPTKVRSLIKAWPHPIVTRHQADALIVAHRQGTRINR